MSGLAPEMSRRAKLCLFAVDPEVNGFGSLAMKADHVHPGLFQFCRKLPPRVGTGHRPGQRRFRHDHISGPGGGLGAGQGTGGHDQNVIRSQRIAIWVNFREQALNAQTSSADKIFGDSEGPATLPAPTPLVKSTRRTLPRHPYMVHLPWSKTVVSGQWSVGYKTSATNHKRTLKASFRY